MRARPLRHALASPAAGSACRPSCALRISVISLDAVWLVGPFVHQRRHQPVALAQPGTTALCQWGDGERNSSVGLFFSAVRPGPGQSMCSTALPPMRRQSGASIASAGMTMRPARRRERSLPAQPGPGKCGRTERLRAPVWRSTAPTDSPISLATCRSVVWPWMTMQSNSVRERAHLHDMRVIFVRIARHPEVRAAVVITGAGTTGKGTGRRVERPACAAR